MGALILFVSLSFLVSFSASNKLNLHYVLEGLLQPECTTKYSVHYIFEFNRSRTTLKLIKCPILWYRQTSLRLN